MNSNTIKFIKDLENKCKIYNIKLTFKNSRSVDGGGGTRIGGYFDYGNMELAVARKHKDWLSLLVHESCHVDQWSEQSKLWTQNIDEDGKVDKWILGAKVKYIKKSLEDTLQLELDCEKRAVKKIKKYKLPINIKTYIQRANAYVQFYNYLYETRKWSKPHNSPYTNKNVYSVMPSIFREKKYYKTLPIKVRQIFIKEKI